LLLFEERRGGNEAKGQYLSCKIKVLIHDGDRLVMPENLEFLGPKPGGFSVLMEPSI
jgi:hypothetical protein